jgi:hypothetical protein
LQEPEKENEPDSTDSPVCVCVDDNLRVRRR